MQAEKLERLFVSLALPEPCRDALVALYQKIAGITWTRPEQLHLTMRFLGEVPTELAEAIETSLGNVAVEPFLLPLENTGVFPQRGTPRVLWAGTGKADTRLFQLRQQIDDAVLAAGWRGELRAFVPHITLGRIHDAEPKAIERWLHRHASFAGPLFRVDAFQLMASELRPAGAVHALRQVFPLRKRDAAAKHS